MFLQIIICSYVCKVLVENGGAGSHRRKGHIIFKLFYNKYSVFILLYYLCESIMWIPTLCPLCRTFYVFPYTPFVTFTRAPLINFMYIVRMHCTLFYNIKQVYFESFKIHISLSVNSWMYCSMMLQVQRQKIQEIMWMFLSSASLSVLSKG